MRTAAKPRQSPCVGRGDSNWQGQAKSQLQLLTSTPSMYQSTCAMVSSFRATTPGQYDPAIVLGQTDERNVPHRLRVRRALLVARYLLVHTFNPRVQGSSP